jgi:hypothetical protein
MPIRKPKFCVIIPVHAPPCYKGSPWFIIISYIWYNDISSSIIYVVCIYMIYHHHIYIFFTYMIYISYHIHHIRVVHISYPSYTWAQRWLSGRVRQFVWLTAYKTRLSSSILVHTQKCCKCHIQECIISHCTRIHYGSTMCATCHTGVYHTVHVLTMETPYVQHVTLACITLYMYSQWKHYMCNMLHPGVAGFLCNLLVMSKTRWYNIPC